jgi:hypothetical protein
MYCNHQEVTFSEEMKPRVEWTLKANYRFAIQLTAFCKRSCFCSFDENGQPSHHRRQLTAEEIWTLPEGRILVLHPNGEIVLGNQLTGESSTMIGGASSSGTQDSTMSCGQNVTANCPDPWPIDLLGPVPIDLPWVSGSMKQELLSTINMCRSSCQKISECGGADSGCKCRVANPAEARAEGLDPVFPGAVCMAILASMVTSQAISKQGSWSFGSLWGRDVRETVEDGSNLPCPCNASYVSHAFCLADNDGILWEDARLKLGILEL